MPYGDRSFFPIRRGKGDLFSCRGGVRVWRGCAWVDARAYVRSADVLRGVRREDCVSGAEFGTKALSL